MRYPYNVMRHADWDAAPRDPISIGASIAASLSVTSKVGILLIQAATYVAVSAVTSWALNALAPKPDFSSANSGGILVNNRGAAKPQDFVYGQIRKGGTVVYDETTGTNNKFLHRVIALAGHEVEEIGDIYINDEVVSVDGSGFVGGKWENKIRINKHLGDQTTADADLLSESGQIDSNFVGRGIAYIYVRFAYDQDVFANGLPLITAVVKGKKVYDPRTNSTAYSDNAALCLRDYLVSEYGLNDDDIDDVAFQAAANECDVDVDLAGGGTEKKYTMNGRITADSNHGDTLQRMVTSCAGTLFWGMGKWKLVAGAYSAPVKTLTENDLRGPISVQPRVNIRDNFNTVRGTFNDADEDWITVDYPQVTSSVFKAEDGGDELPLDLELPFTTSPATAQRLAKLTLYRAREQIRVDADFSLDAFDVQVGDIISFSFERYGWTQKEFEVVGWKMSTSEGGAPRVRLSLQETSEAAFDWNAEESAIIANNSSLLSYTDVPTLGIPSGQIVPSLRIVREKLTEVISINVTTGRPEGVAGVEVQFKEAGNTEWKAMGSGGLGRYEVVDIEPGVYQFRARAVNGFGYRGPFTTTQGTHTAGAAAAPQDVVGLFYEVSDGTTTLEWNPVIDLDLSFYRIRHAVETSGASWANATTAVDKVPRPGTSVALPTRPGTYMIRAYDKTGIASENTTEISVGADEIPGFIESLSQSEDGTFSGTKTGCEVNSSRLEITDVSGSQNEGTYDFSTYIETHDMVARRVRARVDAATLRLDRSSGGWDNISGVWDDFPGAWDDWTGDPQIADTDILFYIRTTLDDPSGTPSWSDWKKFRAGDFYGRAFEFRCVLKSSSKNITPSVGALTAYVEYN